MKLTAVLVCVVLACIGCEAIKMKELKKLRKKGGYRNMASFAKDLFEQLERCQGEANPSGGSIIPMETELPDVMTKKNTKSGGSIAAKTEITKKKLKSGKVAAKIEVPVLPEVPEVPDVTGGDGRDEDVKKAFIDAHNAARSSESEANPALPDVAWDYPLAEKCQTNVDRCSMKHDVSGAKTADFSSIGQNLYWTSGTSGDATANAKRAVDSWMKEKKDWDTTNKVCIGAWWKCGHYTQVVWRDTTHIGCAIKVCEGDGTYVCCNYGPAGNVQGNTPY